MSWFLLFAWQPASAPATPPQRETTRSPHGALNIPCENCHTASGWRPIRAVPEFDHNKTKYPLRGMHEKVQCTQCHIKPVFTDVGKNCADCHADIHRRKFGSDCAQCHTLLGWQVSIQQIKYHQNRFPLLGAHGAVQCEECHKGAAVGQYQGLSTQCASCHLKDYQRATNPNHITAQFATTCESCHSADSWLGAKFDHNATGFPLTNGHASVPCASCHINGNYNLQIAPTDCGNSGCHLTKWQQTTNPVHSSAGPIFAVANCANCHTTKGWDSANFNHAQFFPLTNAHAGLQCSQCHRPGTLYSAAPTTCQGCHMDKYNAALTPINHVQVGFPPALCSTCHDTIAWMDAKFNHSTTGWPLQGAHVNTPCASCHIGINGYNLQPADTDCYHCHMAAWQSTVTLGGAVPNHIAANYPTTCVACHTTWMTTNWLGATFNHTWFRIPHNGSVCSDCHLVSTNYATFSCINCHTRTAHQPGMSHPSVGGQYVYGATTCYNCHKQ